MSQTRLVLPRSKRRRVRYMRMLRATLWDSLALWREFRVPFTVFILAVFVGGWLYGELLIAAGYDAYPFFDRPYMMLQLMILETPPPGFTPPEPYLIIFWYLMPAIAIYIIGRGAVDFVRLFFNRSERHDAWELAVAATYRNHVILVGVGHVGLRVTRVLVDMGFDVVAVDSGITDELDDELSGIGVPVIVADGRLKSTLETAGLQHARALIVCTSNDHVNLEVTMRARDMHPDVRIVVRMWDNRFAEQLKRFMGVEVVLSASDLAAPAFAGSALGIDVAQTLHINGEDYSMIRLIVRPRSFMDGAVLGELEEDNDIDIMLHQRDHDVKVHPPGDIIVAAGDSLVLFAKHSKITEIVSHNRPYTHR